MLLRGAFTVELFYDLMTNGAADSLALLKLFIRHEPNLEIGSMHISCSLSKHHVSRFSHSRIGLLFVDKRRCHCAASVKIVHITETE